MADKELIEILDKKFATKKDHEDLVTIVGTLSQNVNSLTQRVSDLTQNVNNLTQAVSNLVQDSRDLKSEMRSGFAEVNERLDELKSSANAFDKMLEARPIPRIERLETHAGLPPLASAHAGE